VGLEGPRLTVPNVIEVGEVWASPQFECAIPLENLESSNARVNLDTSTCGCSAKADAKSPLVTIPSGSTQSATVKLNLYRFAPTDSAPEWAFEIPVKLLVEWQDVDSTRRSNFKIVTVSGRARRFFQLDRSMVNFSASHVHGEEWPPEFVILSCAKPVDSLTAVADPNDAITNVIPLSESNDIFQVSVIPSSQLPVGVFSFALNIDAVSTDGSVHAIAVRACGQNLARLRAVPSTVAFGPVPLGEVRSERISIVTHTTTALASVSANADNDLLRVVSNDSLERHELEVSLTTSTPGEGRAVVSAVATFIDGKNLSLTIPVSWRGLTALGAAD
jgi:hypothetical protein